MSAKPYFMQNRSMDTMITSSTVRKNGWNMN